jgi:quinol monooxygenase YgiN
MSVTITLRLTTDQPAAFLHHLARVLPETRCQPGCRYINTFVQTNNPNEIILIQGWDSLMLQQQYIEWRQATGALDEFRAFLISDPIIEQWQLCDA